MGFCGGGPFRRYATDRSLLASRHHEWTQAQAHYDPGAYKRFSVGLPLLLLSRICTQPRQAGMRILGPRLQGREAFGSPLPCWQGPAEHTFDSTRACCSFCCYRIRSGYVAASSSLKAPGGDC